MLSKTFLLVIMLVGVRSAAAQTAAAVPTDDVQLWNDVQIAVPLNGSVDMNFTGSFRLGRNLTHPVSERGGVSFSFKARKFLTLETGYLYVASQPSEGRKSYNSTLSAGATIKFPIRRFVVSSRSQFERRFRSPQVDSNRYRHRMRIETPVKIGERKFNVFVSNEMFYDFRQSEWTRNRFAAGMNKKLSKNLSYEWYYMRQNDGRSRPGDLHILGSILKVQL